MAVGEFVGANCVSGAVNGGLNSKNGAVKTEYYKSLLFLLLLSRYKEDLNY